MKAFFVILGLGLAVAAQAHDLWLEQEQGHLSLCYGHSRSEHKGAEFIDYPAEWVREALCVDEMGKPLAVEAGKGSPFRMKGECAATYVLTSSGYWTKTPYGTKNVPKSEAQMVIKSWLSYENVKRIDRWGAALAGPLTEDLEIIPLENPLVLEPGNKLRLLVTYQREPAESVVVTYDGKPRGQTGADGRINIRVRHWGFQLIQASVSRPDPSGKADEIIHTANLNLDLAER
jgi:nickel transport protein